MNRKRVIYIIGIMSIFFLAMSCASANENIENNTEINDYYISNATNFKELQKDLDEHNNIKLANNVIVQDNEIDTYKYGLNINTPHKIDGNGHTIDAKNKTRIFQVNCNCIFNITNTTLINGYSNDGSAIYSWGDLNIDNCTFINNKALYHGGCIVLWSLNHTGHLECKNSYFYNNSANRGGIASIEGTCNFTLCEFIHNKAPYLAATAYIEGNGTSTFKYNVFMNDPMFKMGEYYHREIFGGFLTIENNYYGTDNPSVDYRDITLYFSEISKIQYTSKSTLMKGAMDSSPLTLEQYTKIKQQNA